MAIQIPRHRVLIIGLVFLGLVLSAVFLWFLRGKVNDATMATSTQKALGSLGQADPEPALLLTQRAQLEPTDWYVSRTGDNQSGRSWETAWNELDQIDWSLMQPGDIVMLDGGPVECPSLGADYRGDTCGMVYNSPLVVDIRGAPDAPIVIRLASDEGRDGTVIIDGGATGGTRCPGYPDELYPPDSMAVPSSPGEIDPENPIEIGIDLRSSEWVVVDGTKWGGIEIRNTERSGFSFNQGRHILAKYLKVHHIRGISRPVLVFQRPNSGFNVIAHSELFGSGQDVVHAAGDNFTVEYNYIHDNYCYHPDGLQSYSWPGYPDGEPHGEIRNLIVRYNIIESMGNLVDNQGSHGMGVFLGESDESAFAWVDGADIHDNLILDVKDAGIRVKNPETTNVRVYRNTVVGTGRWAIQWYPGSKTPMEIFENVFYNNGLTIDGESFHLFTDDGETLFTNNCYYNDKVPIKEAYGDVAEMGTISQHPLFVNESSGDYALSADSPCAGMGSSITSVETLIGLDTEPK